MSLRSLLFIAILSGAAFAQDVVVLKNGARLEGEVIHESESELTLQFPGGSVRLPASQIARVDRAEREVPVEIESGAARRGRGLARFGSDESHYFLYRRGIRVGWRKIVIAPQEEGEIPGYKLSDHLVFVEKDSSAAAVELLVEEEVDPELRPVRARWRSVSGDSTREISGEREGDIFSLVQKLGGKATRSARLRLAGLRLPGIWMRAIAGRAARTGSIDKTRILEIDRLSVREVSAKGRRERLTVWGEPQLVDVVFLESSGRPTLTSWVGGAGSPLREELRGGGLVAIRAPQEMVEAYARGESSDGKSDLGLEVLSERAGLRLLRPDLAWEMEFAGSTRKRVLSLFRPSLRATVDLFLIPDEGDGATAEALALRLFDRMQRSVQGIDATPPQPCRIGDQRGMEFECVALTKGKEVRTRVAVVRKDARAVAILCAAPESEYKKSAPEFQKILDSLRLFDAKILAEKKKPESKPGPGS